MANGNKVIVNRPRNDITRIGMQRAGSLGQLDKEFNYGPSPLHPRDVPIDLRQRYISKGIPGGVAIDPTTGLPVPGTPDFSQLVRDVHNIAGVVVLRRGLLGRVVTVTSTPQLIIDQVEEDGRGYLLLNPAAVVGLTAEGTLFSTQTVVGASAVTSGTLGVANYKTLALVVIATFVAGAGPVTFDWQTRDPVTNAFVTVQTVFNLIATGNSYANVGGFGVDVDGQMVVTVPAGTTITFSVGFILKDGLEGTSAGASQTIFFGGAGVSPVSGYPLLEGKERQFFLEENVKLYAVTDGPNLDMNIFEL